jgi:hypothetical protein
MRLSLNDYKLILKYYNIDISGMKNSAIRKRAEGILAEKLCRCIKTVDKSKTNKNIKAIAVCKNSVLTKKHLKISKFSCKKKATFLTSKKNKDEKIVKTTKKLRF